MSIQDLDLDSAVDNVVDLPSKTSVEKLPSQPSIESQELRKLDSFVEENASQDQESSGGISLNPESQDQLGSNTESKLANSLDTEWQASLEVELTHSERGTALKRCRHNGPLYIQRPFYPEGKDLAHLYVLHPPGGIVSGDQLTMKFTVKKQSAALVTTPGAGKMYRARSSERPQTQNVCINVHDDASFEWFPLENIFFPGANAAISTEVNLSERAKFIGWDINSFGLPAQKQRFDKGVVKQKLRLVYNKRPVIIESLCIGDRHSQVLSSNAGMQNFSISGIILAGPFHDKEIVDALVSESRKLLDELAKKEHVTGRYLVAVSVVNQFIVARYLGECSELSKQIFVKLWHKWRPALLKRLANEPRIWLT